MGTASGQSSAARHVEISSGICITVAVAVGFGVAVDVLEGIGVMVLVVVAEAKTFLSVWGMILQPIRPITITKIIHNENIFLDFDMNPP
ncbi:MAG: hypothetical protein CVU45_02890 [Chloroflexi bacterium HGW-Chloroflexi-7]|nr:MAG: hypothetical protein CVU45_02890 [Chloroflexi bacterium HGW-Chloroflexi-7]